MKFVTDYEFRLINRLTVAIPKCKGKFEICISNLSLSWFSMYMCSIWWKKNEPYEIHAYGLYLWSPRGGENSQTWGPGLRRLFSVKKVFKTLIDSCTDEHG